MDKPSEQPPPYSALFQDPPYPPQAGVHVQQPPAYSAPPPGIQPSFPLPPAPGFVPTYGTINIINQAPPECEVCGRRWRKEDTCADCCGLICLMLLSTLAGNRCIRCGKHFR